MDKNERMRRTANVRSRRSKLYRTLWAWKGWNEEEVEQYCVIHYSWVSQTRIAEYMEDYRQEHRRLEGQFRNFLPNHSYRERDWYIHGLQKKMRIANDDFGNWLDECGIPHDFSHFRNRKDRNGKIC